jgi:hypothetical protein
MRRTQSLSFGLILSALTALAISAIPVTIQFGALGFGA